MQSARWTKGKAAAGWLCAGLVACAGARADVIEVLHAWDDGDDGAAVEVLRQAVTRQGHTWQDFIVAGGSGNGMATALLDGRVRSGNPPAVAQVRTPAIARWAQQGQLASVDAVARGGNWDALLPAAVRNAVQYDGRYVAVPLNIHRLNWLWINTQALKRAGATVPTTWDQFFDTAEKLKRAGYVAVAHGGERWQDNILFGTVALGVGGPGFYTKALTELDPEALASPTMVRVLQTFRRIKPYTRQGPVRRWMTASDALVDGSAGMQFMGDWAKPRFLHAQARTGWSFECVPAPGTARVFLFTTDTFAFFRLPDAAGTRAQQDFASMAMSGAVQARFSQMKGSIPARLDTDAAPADRCGEMAAAAYRRSARNGSLLPSMAMSVRPALELEIPDIISAFWRDDRVTPAMTIARLVQAVRRHP